MTALPAAKLAELSIRAMSSRERAERAIDAARDCRINGLTWARAQRKYFPEHASRDKDGTR